MTIKSLNNCSTATSFRQSTRGDFHREKRRSYGFIVEQPESAFIYLLTQNGWKSFPLSGEGVRHLFEESSCWMWQASAIMKLLFSLYSVLLQKAHASVEPVRVIQDCSTFSTKHFKHWKSSKRKKEEVTQSSSEKGDSPIIGTAWSLKLEKCGLETQLGYTHTPRDFIFDAIFWVCFLVCEMKRSSS